MEALIGPNNCDVGHYTRFVDGGDASVGALICRGIPLAVEWSE
jgi:hypothetical protein